MADITRQLQQNKVWTDQKLDRAEFDKPPIYGMI